MLDPSGWKSRSTSEIGSRHQADLDLKLDGSGSRGRMDGFRYTGLWFYGLTGRSFASQDPRSHYRKRQAQEMKTRKGKVHPTRQPRAGYRSRILDSRPHPDPSRETTGSEHYTAMSMRICHPTCQDPQVSPRHSLTLGLLTSYQRSKIQPYRQLHNVTKFSTDHGSSADPLR
ncbi:unnamed protein product [Phytophthora fragariaefolia]|uniref:Unnamed protein product n=1 Tax=Phytophthora fragariaefolia TaxID=1490495 RepID=A0A9W6U8D3_9STRA|nr:unnamed protein product [Phytophthora fragariaefolia]